MYLNIINLTGFINVLHNAENGYRVIGNLASGINKFDVQTQTIAKVNFGTKDPNGQPISYAVIITSRDADGNYRYMDVVNNIKGIIPANKIVASITIFRE